jgi:hypothetical protein
LAVIGGQQWVGWIVADPGEGRDRKPQGTVMLMGFFPLSRDLLQGTSAKSENHRWVECNKLITRSAKPAKGREGEGERGGGGGEGGRKGRRMGGKEEERTKEETRERKRG